MNRARWKISMSWTKWDWRNKVFGAANATRCFPIEDTFTDTWAFTLGSSSFIVSNARKVSLTRFTTTSIWGVMRGKSIIAKSVQKPFKQRKGICITRPFTLVTTDSGAPPVLKDITTSRFMNATSNIFTPELAKTRALSQGRMIVYYPLWIHNYNRTIVPRPIPSRPGSPMMWTWPAGFGRKRLGSFKF